MRTSASGMTRRLAASAVLALVAAGSAAAAPDPAGLWGTPRALPGDSCDPPVAMRTMRDGDMIALSGVAAPLRAVRIAAPASGDAARVETSCLFVPLANELLLDGRTIAVTIVYHAGQRAGWSSAMVAARVNGHAIAFDRLGGGNGPNELRLRVVADSVIAAGGVRLLVRIRAQARRGGAIRAAIDMLRLEPA